MTKLSLAAQAVDTALAACIQLQGEIIKARPLAAAALEAVANEVVPEPIRLPRNSSYAEGAFDQRLSDRRRILAIAAELRGTTTNQEDYLSHV